MKKLSRRELFKRTAQAGVGGAALAVGLKPTKAAPVALPSISIPHGSKTTNLQATITVTCGPIRKWSSIFNDDVRLSGLGSEYEMSVEEE